MTRPAYGQDAPGIMAGFLAAGAALIAAGVAIGGLGLITAAIGAAPLGLGAAMLAYGRAGKLRVRDRMIASLAWTGEEQVLDVGTGAGLLLIGAARRLTTGRATGIDVWAAKDLSGNGPDAAAQNAAVEGVADRIEVRTADARALPMADASVDRVLSLLCIHNIDDAAGRARACAEIARVLKPGGVALIGEYMPMGGYAEAFRAAGLRIALHERWFGTALSLMWMLRAEKPAAGGQRAAGPA